MKMNRFGFGSWLLILGALANLNGLFPALAQIVIASDRVPAGIQPESPPLAPSNLRAEATTPHHVGLSWQDNSSNERGFVAERKRGVDGPWELIWLDMVANAVGASDDYAEAGTQYFYRVKFFNEAGDSPYSNEAEATTFVEGVISLAALPAQDGYVVESSEHRNVGGLVQAFGGGSAALRAGDTHQDRQCKAFVSFNTRPIPDGARIMSVTLKLKRGRVFGTDPFRTHGLCIAEIKGGGGFNASPGLQSADFQAKANLPWGSMRVTNDASGFSVVTLHPDAHRWVNKTGVTQFRIYFAKDDNDDRSPDLACWYSGENPTAANRPALEVTYWQQPGGAAAPQARGSILRP